MATTREGIARWFKEGVEEKATHLIVVCDTFDWEDYPVYVKPTEDVKRVHEEYDNHSMQKVMEVYNLSMDMAEQVNRPRCFQY